MPAQQEESDLQGSTGAPLPLHLSYIMQSVDVSTRLWACAPVSRCWNTAATAVRVTSVQVHLSLTTIPFASDTALLRWLGRDSNAALVRQTAIWH